MRERLAISTLAVTLLVAGNVFAGWTEIGNAGNLPGTAQIVWGSGPLDSIMGSISPAGDIDMFGIFISDPVGFSATTLTGNDPMLYLFDNGGLAVYGNDDWYEDNSEAHLPTKGEFPGYGPTSSGFYYLAIARYPAAPWGTQGQLFATIGIKGDPLDPELYIPLTYPTPNPINDWQSVQPTVTFDYTITFAGAQYVIPAPGAAILGGIGAALVSWLRRRRTL